MNNPSPCMPSMVEISVYGEMYLSQLFTTKRETTNDI